MTAPVTRYTREEMLAEAEWRDSRRFCQVDLSQTLPERIDPVLERWDRQTAMLRQAASDDSRYRLHIYSLRACLEHFKAVGKLPSEIGDRLLASYIDMPDPEGGNPEALNNTPRQAAAEGRGNEPTAGRLIELRRVLRELEAAEVRDNATPTEPTPRAVKRCQCGERQDQNPMSAHRIGYTEGCLIHGDVPTEPTPPPAVGVPTCATCVYVTKVRGGAQCEMWRERCQTNNGIEVPADGSGFCHLHSEAK